MRIPSSVIVRAALAVTAVIGSVALFSAPKAPFTRHDKAYYLDAAQVNFIRPGLVITVKSDGVYLNTQRMNSPKDLANAIGAQMRSRPLADKVVFINSEDQIPFDRSVEAMDAAHEGGAVKIGFLTDAPKQ